VATSTRSTFYFVLVIVVPQHGKGVIDRKCFTGNEILEHIIKYLSSVVNG